MGSRRTGTLGKQAERTALRFLVRNGLTLVTRNYRCRGGEIDLIMLDGECLTFVEVRCRTSAHFSAPELTVDSRKQRKLLRTAAMFIGRRRRYALHTIRFDVVAITGRAEVDIRWIEDAFRPQDSTL
ncbi:MAG: YraN family protein [Woeseiaceae bacterium]